VDGPYYKARHGMNPHLIFLNYGSN
jgi:hypothetical protein